MAGFGVGMTGARAAAAEPVARLRPPVREVTVDLDAIAALEAAFGPDRCAEVVQDAACEAVDRLVAIERALEVEDWSRIARAARQLSGIAARIGLGPLAAQAEALEICCQCLDRTAAHAVAGRLLRTGEAALSCTGLGR